ECEDNNLDSPFYDMLVYNNNLDFAVTYHYSADDALYNVNAIPEPLVSNFLATDGQDIFVRVTTIYDDEIFQTTSFKLWIHELPTAYPLPTVVSCEINGAGL